MHLQNLIYLKYKLCIDFRYYWKGEIRDTSEILLVCWNLFKLQLSHSNQMFLFFKDVYALMRSSILSVLLYIISYCAYAMYTKLMISLACEDKNISGA